jgi:hypothetical protein
VGFGIGYEVAGEDVDRGGLERVGGVGVEDDGGAGGRRSQRDKTNGEYTSARNAAEQALSVHANPPRSWLSNGLALLPEAGRSPTSARANGNAARGRVSRGNGSPEWGRMRIGKKL